MANSTNTFKRRLDTYWQGSYKEPEVVVKNLDMTKWQYCIGYVKVWNEAGIEV